MRRVLAIDTSTATGRIAIAAGETVLFAGTLAMASALQANLLASSRVAQAMARDRTLPRRLEHHNSKGAPQAAIYATAAIVIGTTLAVGEVAAAGAAATSGRRRLSIRFRR